MLASSEIIDVLNEMQRPATLPESDRIATRDGSSCCPPPAAKPLR
jgi:hypothetical protein